jgi:hypothetical protein
MTITLNDTVFDNVTELNARRTARKTDVKYNTQGDLLIDLVNRKYELEVVFGLLSQSEMESLRKITEEIFVTAKFDAPEGEVTEEFYIAEEPAPAVTVVNGVTMYGGVKLAMKQK